MMVYRAWLWRFFLPKRLRLHFAFVSYVSYEEGKRLTLKTIAFEKGAITTDHRDRPAIRFESTISEPGRGAAGNQAVNFVNTLKVTYAWRFAMVVLCETVAADPLPSIRAEVATIVEVPPR